MYSVGEEEGEIEWRSKEGFRSLLPLGLLYIIFSLLYSLFSFSKKTSFCFFKHFLLPIMVSRGMPSRWNTDWMRKRRKVSL